MEDLFVRNKLEVRENLANWLNEYSEFYVCNDQYKINVKLSKDNYVELKPNPTHYRWDFKFYDDYKAEICSAINSVIFKNKNIHHLHDSIRQTGVEEHWYFDTRTGKAFYISNGKIYREKAEEDPFYQINIEEAKDKLHIDRVLITDDYKLTKKDLEAIENTDVTPERLLKEVLSNYKGKYATSDLGKRALGHIWRYNYKFHFNCERCGKETFEWHKHDNSAFIDYLGPFYCDECAAIVEKENEEKAKKEQEEHEYRMANDPQYRKEWEERPHLTLHKLSMPDLIKSEDIVNIWGKDKSTKKGKKSKNDKDINVAISLKDLFTEKPMDLPRDTIYYTDFYSNRTKGE